MTTQELEREYGQKIKASKELILVPSGMYAREGSGWRRLDDKPMVPR